MQEHSRFPHASRRALGTPRAFTLVEILVVIAIIAVLGALAFPVLSNSLDQTKEARCSHHLRSLGLAIQSYTVEHSGHFPPSTHSTGTVFTKAWIFQLVPYLGGELGDFDLIDQFGQADEFLISPGDPQARDRLAAMHRTNLPNSSYLYNSFLDEPEHDRIAKLTTLSRTIILFPASDDVGISLMNDHIHGRNWDRGWNAMKSDLQPNRFRRGASNADKTNGKAAYLFADGHVETIRASDLQTQIVAGDNPARP